MPSLKTITPIIGGYHYHLFNRGVNHQKIFFQERNFSYFIRLVDQFLSEYVIFLAYALLPNHFHFVVRIKDRICYKGKIIEDENLIGETVVNQLKRLFITYSMAINNQEGREGSLFEPKYKRLMIEYDEYLLNVISYTHINPEKHEIVNDYRKYKYSSYYSIISGERSIVNIEYLLDIFGGMKDFLNFHQIMHLSSFESNFE